MSTEMNKAENMMFLQPQAQTLNIQIPQHSTLQNNRHSQSNTASSKRFIPQVVNIKQQKQQMAKISS
jgi:hypothetical protein